MQTRRTGPRSPSETLAGSSRAVIEGNWIHLSSVAGFDYTSMRIDPDPAEQARQCFRTIAATLRPLAASLDDVVRVRYLLAEADLFETLAPVFAEHLRRAAPAATVMVVGLVDPRVKLEIEVTALRMDPGTYAA